MAFFPRYTDRFGADFAPLFKLLDEGFSDVGRSGGRHASVRAFAPKFDVSELKDSYQLHGELPGIDQKNIQIEFTDPHTLVISGRTERSYTSADPSAGTLEGVTPQGRIEGTVSDDASSNKSHQATVEDEAAVSDNQPSSTEVSTTQAKQGGEVSQPQSQYKSWISERSIGEFHRSFSFPQRVDQDLVKASLKNGILSIVVPKAKAPESRRINIE